MGNETGTDSKKVEDYKYIDSKCIVKFRPADDWEGEYGFDWFREGDYGEKELNNGRRKSYYKDDRLIGKYGYIDHGRFVPIDPHYLDRVPQGKTIDIDITQSVDGVVINADSYGKKYYYPIPIKDAGVFVLNQYYVPSISLFYNKVNNTTTTNGSNPWEYKVTVKLIIHAVDILFIDFVVDEGTKGVILNPRGIGGKNGDFEHELSITLTSDFAKNIKDVSIRAIATHKMGVSSTLLNKDITKTLAGKISILKHELKYIDVLIVPIFVDSNVPSNLNNMLEEEKKRLEKFFSQAQIVPLVDTGKRINNADSQRMIATLIDAASKYVLDSQQIPVRKCVTPKTVINTTFNGQVIISGTSLHVEFEKLFEGEPYDDNTKNAYKVFYILYEGNCSGEAAGFPNDTPKPPKNVIVFEPHWDETPIHELFHRLGLQHSFSNSNSYTFKIHGTSNIMDYAKSGGFKRRSSWRWQWDEIRKQIDEDKQQDQNYNIT